VLFAAALRDFGHGPLLWRVWAVKTREIDELILPDEQADDSYVARWLRNRGCGIGVQRAATAYVRSASGLHDFAKQYLRDVHDMASLERALPSTTSSPPTLSWALGVRSAARAATREPLGFILYLTWRTIIRATPRERWLPVVALSRFDQSASTKDLGVVGPDTWTSPQGRTR
jgi:hypothetical protein